MLHFYFILEFKTAFLILNFTSVFLLFLVGECPSTHPFAYDGGHMCCNVNKENYRGIAGCNEEWFTEQSNCCDQDEKRCPKKGCVDHPDVVGSK